MILSHTTLVLFYRLIVAACLGGVVGLERDIRGRAAGLRTHALVCVGSALFMILSELISSGGDLLVLGQISPFDPGRIAAQIVTGIGFLGAGAILKQGVNVTGLTTASCLWVVAAIGMAAGSGHYEIAVFVTLISLIVLLVFRLIDKMHKSRSLRILTISTSNDTDISQIVDIVKKQNLKIVYFDQNKNYKSGVTTIRLSIVLFHKGITDKLSHAIIGDLEASSIQLFSVRWDHKDSSLETND